MKKSVKLFILSVLLLSFALMLIACSDTGNQTKKTEQATITTESTSQSESTSEASITAGKYQASAKGYNGDIELTVEVDDKGKILAINVDNQQESKDIGTVPIKKIPGKIVEEQSLAVDTIAGATVTNNAILAAVASALEDAGADPANYNYQPKEMAQKESTLDYTLSPDSMPKKAEKTVSVVVTDARGREVEIPLPISSYAISTMDVIDYIIPLKGEDAFNMLVGSGQDGGHGFNAYAELYVPKVGNYLKHTGQISEHNAPFDLEMILAMQPDVLIVNSAMGAHKYALDIEEQLAQIGTKVVLINVPGKRLDKSVQETMGILGKIFQEEEKAAEVSKFLDEQYNIIKAKDLAARQDKPKVYYEKSGYSEVFGPTSTSKGGWGQVIALAGGENIADPILGDSPAGKGASNTLDPEMVLNANPDYIILSGINSGWLDIINGKSKPSFDIVKRNGWQDLDAVKNNNVYEFAHATSRSIYAFYPTLKMAKIFYPEEFKDIDPEAKLEEFFEKFMLLDSNISTWSYNLNDAK